MSQSNIDIRTAYDKAASAYADRFLDELTHKPSDVELLAQFAASVGIGQHVLDLGCGPGHTTAHLASLGLKPSGVDLSPEMVDKASALFPDLDFIVGNFNKLSDHDESLAGLVAFYCIVHLQPEQLVPAFREMYRILQFGGVLLLAFHIGTAPVHVDDFLQTGAQLEFYQFRVADVHIALLATGYSDIEIYERPPYDTEYPTNRCYIFAYKRQTAEQSDQDRLRIAGAHSYAS